MPLNEPSFSEKLIRRRESVRRTLRKTSPEELCALVRKLAPKGTHPWAESFSKFIDEHQAELAVRGETSDGISFVYYPQSNRGIWYAYKEKRVVGVGLLGETNLKGLPQICSETGH